MTAIAEVERIDLAQEAATARAAHADAVNAWNSVLRRERKLQMTHVYERADGTEEDLSNSRGGLVRTRADEVGLTIARQEIEAEKMPAARALRAAEQRMRSAL